MGCVSVSVAGLGAAGSPGLGVDPELPNPGGAVSASAVPVVHEHVSRGEKRRRAQLGSHHVVGRALPRRVLVVFSGPLDRPDGLAAELRKLGFEVVEVDTLAGIDIRTDAVFLPLLAEVRAGRFCCVFLAVPCSTYSVARIRVGLEPDDGPPQVRDLHFPMGFPGLDDGWAREVRAANDVTERSVVIAHAACTVGASVIIENPVARGHGSPWGVEEYLLHAALWDMPRVRGWAELWGAASTDLAQCGVGGEFQKLTTLLYSSCLRAALSALSAALCTHVSHAAVAHGVGGDGEYVSARAAAYPAPFCLALARAIAFPLLPCWPPARWESCFSVLPCSASPGGALADGGCLSAVVCDACAGPAASCATPEHVSGAPFFGPDGLRSGSARPHAAEVKEGDARVERTTPTANLRRLEPELDSVLSLEALPRVNVPPVTVWADPPPPLPVPLPGPLATSDLIPESARVLLRDFRVKVKACFEAAGRGRWRWARDHRPSPLHLTEEQCLLPAGRGFVWLQSDVDGLWRPLEPSSWPSQPPDHELEVRAILEEALAMGFTDMEIISFIAHGYPGPKMSREAVLGPPHVGALKGAEAFLKCAAKDRDRGWTRGGSPLPRVWPMRADPMNVVFRHGKPRMTIDKTMELIEGLPSYNQLIDLEGQPVIEYVRVSQLGRAAAVLLTAGVEVRLFGFDLEAYFRKTGKQRADWWMSGHVHPDGFGFDTRIQFGQREAPVLTGRQSCFLRAAVHRELSRLEVCYPSRAASVVQWLAQRLAGGGGEGGGDLQSLFFVLIFVDDVGGAAVDDALYDDQGRPVLVWVGGESRQQTRAELYYLAAVGVIRSFGHADAEGKGVPPALSLVFLGLTLDLRTRLVSLSDFKVDSYGELLEAVLSGEAGAVSGERVFAAVDQFNSLVHKLLHACCVVLLGRQHLFYCLRALRTVVHLRVGSSVPVAPDVQRELRWWASALERARSVGVPLASRTAFPDASAQGVLAPYSDASRELATPASSGWGAWAIVGGVFVYVVGRWLPWELAGLSINVLELAAMQFGTFTFISFARSRGLPVTHVMEFTDNTAAEHSAERGRPHTERMHTLVSWRFHELARLGVHSSVERVASVDNDVADGLSRGGEKLLEALRIAAGTGMPIMELQVTAAVRSLEELRLQR